VRIFASSKTSLIEQAKNLHGIEVWKMSDIIGELISEVKTKAYRDDVLRTVQLIATSARAQKPIN
jgi:hypothetical protein